jgi:elongation factor P
MRGARPFTTVAAIAFLGMALPLSAQPDRVPPLLDRTHFQTRHATMKISGNAIRPGMVIEHQGRLWRAVKIMHTQPGKGGAYLQVELKDLRDGTKLNERFRSAETVERVRLDQRTFQYLFNDGSMYTFMDTETFEQIALPGEVIGEDQLPYLQENMTVTIEFHEDSPVTVQLPDTVVLTVVEADAVVKGQTAASSYKPAMLDNGVRTMVPPFVEAGTRVVINTADGSYVERAKD